MEEVEEVVPNREVAIGIIAAAAGLGTGLGLGYILTKRHLEVKYAALCDQEVAEAREFYRTRTSSPVVAKPTLDEVVTHLGYDKVSPSEELQNQVEEAKLEAELEDRPANIFDTPQPPKEELEPEWDWASELKARTEAAPYIIHRDEFVQNEREYTQSTLTYFEGDDVICDERDSVIDDRDELIGFDLLDRFGHGSGNKDVLYIRNPVRELDMEIVRSSGSYAQDVHGFLEHTDDYRRPSRVRRGFDDDETS